MAEEKKRDLLRRSRAFGDAAIVACSLIAVCAGGIRAEAASPSFEEKSPASPGSAPSVSAEAEALVAEAFEKNPELAAARSEAKAAGSRAGAAGILSDPMLSVSYENDGSSISLGTEPMSRLTFMVQQAFPYPGRLGAASKLADADAARAALRPARVALALEGAVRRVHADLLEARENQRLVDEQIETWKQIDETIRARYAAGMGTQQDILRAQSERTRLLQQRRRDEAAEAAALAELTRLLGRAAGAPVEVAGRLAPGAPLAVPDATAAVAQAIDVTPEIKEAAALRERSRNVADLARRSGQPDFVASAGYSYRGSLPLMWSAGVGVSIPVFGGRRSKPLVAEADASAESAASTEAALREIARARATERVIRMRQLADEARLDAEGVLVQDRLSVDAALASYRTGAVPFVTVLEALGTFYQDRRAAVGRLAGFLRADADLREYALDRNAPTQGSSPPSSTTSGAGM